MLIEGNALDELKKLEAESIDCCITSPPYYALRDYKVEGQLGLEPTFQLYLDHLIQIFTQVKRVLKKSGTCWVVMGDTYANTPVGKFNGGSSKFFKGRDMSGNESSGSIDKSDLGIPQKSLLMIPSRFAIQMIDSGWILRNDIIWYKPNCMPSSAKDRFTVDYEHIFFFTKDKKYYFKTQYEPLNWDSSRVTKRGYNQPKHTEAGVSRGALDNWKINELGRIKRTVWKIPPKPFPEAHFAVFPEELVRQCLDAGCPSLGTVIDPFSGAGTTYKVALETDRKPIGIELNPDYIEITKRRISPLLAQTKITSLTN